MFLCPGLYVSRTPNKICDAAQYIHTGGDEKYSAPLLYCLSVFFLQHHKSLGAKNNNIELMAIKRTCCVTKTPVSAGLIIPVSDVNVFEYPNITLAYSGAMSSAFTLRNSINFGLGWLNFCFYFSKLDSILYLERSQEC